jgi:tetratricopeptide (TPR) repeat protein
MNEKREDTGKPPTLGELIQAQVFRRYGIPGIVLVAVLCAAFAVWTDWEKVEKIPGVSRLIEYVSRAAVPRADPTRFSVLIAHLANDREHQNEQLIVQLLQEFKGVQVLALDREISPASAILDEDEREGHALARRYLSESGASLLIWGRVLVLGDRTRPSLFITSAIGTTLKPKQYVIATESEFRLPEVFWSDLSDVLRLLIVSQYVGALAQGGQGTVDTLSQLVTRVQKVLEASRGRPEWDQNAKALAGFTLATALATLGNLTSDSKPLEQAASVFGELTREWTFEERPINWAAAQTNLGNALRDLSKNKHDGDLLQQAVTAYREALRGWTRAAHSLGFIVAQKNLGDALLESGLQQSGIVELEQAVSAYDEALRELKEPRPERAPIWSEVHLKKALALRLCFTRTRQASYLQKAVTSFREALREFAPETAPFDWALSESELGFTFVELSASEGGDSYLTNAAQAFQQALTRKQDLSPELRSAVYGQLGMALARLGQVSETVKTPSLGVEASHDGRIAILRQADAALREALKDANAGSSEWADTQHNLGNVLTSVGTAERDIATLRQAVECYRSALKVETRDRSPLKWAAIQNELGTALAMSAILAKGNKSLDAEAATYLDQAIAAFREALTERRRDIEPLDWAATEHNLGNALWSRARHHDATRAVIEEAASAYRAALTVWTPKDRPVHWAYGQRDLGSALAALQRVPTGVNRDSQGAPTE